MGRLHRLLHGCEQFLPHLIQVHLAAQPGVERRDDCGRIVFTAVEAAINALQEALAYRLEEGRDGQGGDDDGHAAVLVDHPAQQRLQAKDQSYVHRGQDEREQQSQETRPWQKAGYDEWDVLPSARDFSSRDQATPAYTARRRETAQSVEKRR
jgi:hypothetical protein